MSAVEKPVAGWNGEPIQIKPVFDDLEDPATVVNHVEELKRKAADKSLLKTQTANNRIEEAKNMPIPQMLFGELWFEGELCILYASSNAGKSILAVQIGDSISRGKSITPLKMEAEPQKVLYFDFEMGPKTFEKRYSDSYRDHYLFDDKFFTVELNPDSEMPENGNFNDRINEAIEAEIKRTGARVLIIDNITYLGSEMEKSKDAIPLMKRLKALKSKYGLSILALAHTPKRYDNQPLRQSDLAGSFVLMAFCDSSFAIGYSSQDKSLRYVKQVKARSCEIMYDAGNVLEYEIAQDGNRVRFVFRDFGNEENHLLTESAQVREEKKTTAKQLREKGSTQREIARELGVSLGTVNNWLKADKGPNADDDGVPF